MTKETEKQFVNIKDPFEEFDALGLDEKYLEELNKNEQAIVRLLKKKYKKNGKILVDEIRKWREENPDASFGDAIYSLFTLMNDLEKPVHKEELEAPDSLELLNKEIIDSASYPVVRTELNMLTGGALEGIQSVPGYPSIGQLSEEELKGVMEKIKDHYKFLAGCAINFKSEELDVDIPGGRTEYLNKALEIYDRFRVGDIEEIINAFLVVYKVEAEANPTYSYDSNFKALIRTCLKYNYFPNDPKIKQYARLYIEERVNNFNPHSRIADKLKQRILDNLDILVSQGILDENENSDIIDKATNF